MGQGPWANEHERIESERFCARPEEQQLGEVFAMLGLPPDSDQRDLAKRLIRRTGGIRKAMMKEAARMMTPPREHCPTCGR